MTYATSNSVQGARVRATVTIGLPDKTIAVTVHCPTHGSTHYTYTGAGARAGDHYRAQALAEHVDCTKDAN